jgi:hypothetical protein
MVRNEEMAQATRFHSKTPDCPIPSSWSACAILRLGIPLEGVMTDILPSTGNAKLGRAKNQMFRNMPSHS